MSVEVTSMIFDLIPQQHLHAFATCGCRTLQSQANEKLWRSPILVGWKSIQQFVDSYSSSKHYVKNLEISTNTGCDDNMDERLLIWRRFFNPAIPILPHLQSLTIKFTWWDHDINLVRMRLGGFATFDAIAQNWPQLKRFYVYNIKVASVMDYYIDKIIRNSEGKRLQKLYIGGGSFINIRSLQKLFKHFPDLKVKISRKCLLFKTLKSGREAIV